ncbi:hypothetical protein LY76DRAFT_55943 [Colletotrichum caudatum]|nr:hypothetical protein LY76DRAFT_55943 [Colletotrichum caudatum]
MKVAVRMRMSCGRGHGWIRSREKGWSGWISRFDCDDDTRLYSLEMLKDDSKEETKGYRKKSI